MFYKMNIKTNLIEEYLNFVEKTKKQNKYFKVFIILFVVILCLIIIRNSIRAIKRMQV